MTTHGRWTHNYSVNKKGNPFALFGRTLWGKKGTSFRGKSDVSANPRQLENVKTEKRAESDYVLISTATF